MINRSKIKYSLQKFLPKMIFGLILGLWQKIFIKIVNAIDGIRLKSFATYRSIKTMHRGHNFSILYPLKTDLLMNIFISMEHTNRIYLI